MTSSQYLTHDQIKMESSSSLSTRGRKRTASQASEASSYRSSSVSSSSHQYEQDRKKLKKYQLDPSKDHTVRNALAAKRNRDKKKAEEQQMKRENMEMKIRLSQLEKELAEYKAREHGLTQRVEEEENTHRLIASFDGSPTVKDALEAIMPRLNTKYGPMTIVDRVISTTATPTAPTIPEPYLVSNIENTVVNNNNNYSYQTDDMMSHQLNYDGYMDDFHIDDDDMPIFSDDDNQKYPLPSDLESSFNFNDLSDASQQLQPTDFVAPSPLSNFPEKDPFFGINISATEKNVIIERNPLTMYSTD